MKRYLIIIVGAILVGGLLAYFTFNKLVLKPSDDSKTNASAFQVGVFSNYENAVKVADRNNGIVVPDDDLYRVYVAILKDNDAIEKVSKYYNEIGLNYYLKEITISKDFVIEIDDAEKLLKKSSTDTYNAINLSVLSKYKEML